MRLVYFSLILFVGIHAHAQLISRSKTPLGTKHTIKEFIHHDEQENVYALATDSNNSFFECYKMNARTPSFSTQLNMDSGEVFKKLISYAKGFILITTEYNPNSYVFNCYAIPIAMNGTIQREKKKELFQITLAQTEKPGTVEISQTSDYSLLVLLYKAANGHAVKLRAYTQTLEMKYEATDDLKELSSTSFIATGRDMVYYLASYPLPTKEIQYEIISHDLKKLKSMRIPLRISKGSIDFPHVQVLKDDVLLVTAFSAEKSAGQTAARIPQQKYDGLQLIKINTISRSPIQQFYIQLKQNITELRLSSGGITVINGLGDRFISSTQPHIIDVVPYAKGFYVLFNTNQLRHVPIDAQAITADDGSITIYAIDGDGKLKGTTEIFRSVADRQSAEKSNNMLTSVYGYAVSLVKDSLVLLLNDVSLNNPQPEQRSRMQPFLDRSALQATQLKIGSTGEMQKAAIIGQDGVLLHPALHTLNQAGSFYTLGSQNGDLVLIKVFIN